MEVEFTDKQYWLSVYTDNGYQYIPEELFEVPMSDIEGLIKSHDWETLYSMFKDYLEGDEIYEPKIIYAYGIRSTAPGYMDCTEWNIYKNKREATKAANEEQRLCNGKEY
jgi:hypothetical protein